MEAVDRMIFDTLSRLSCSFCDGNDGKCDVSFGNEDAGESSSSNIERLSTEDVFEAVVRLLWECDSTTRAIVPSYELSNHSTARFRMANTLANALKRLGLREEFGYQSLLYHNVFDIRRLFLALIEKLPDESLFDQGLSPLEQLKLDTESDMSRHLDAAWVPEFCRYLRMKYDGRFWHPNQEDGGLFPFGQNRPTHPRRRGGADAVISQNDDTDDTASVCSSTSDGGGRRSAQQQKPKIPPKPPHLQRLHLQVTTKESVETGADDTIERREHIEQKHKELIELRYAQVRLESSIEELAKRNDKIDARLLKLLTNPEESLAKLQEFISTATQRRVELQERFFELRDTKHAELQELRATHTPATDCEVVDTPDVREETSQLRQLIDQCRGTLVERTRIKTKLEKELRKSHSSTRSSADDRSNYVRRVLEIVANVNKQNQEIFRTAKAIKKLEHEIEILDGTLERTFIVVESWLGARTESDVRMERAYRLLIRMHQHCALTRAAINERAQIRRNINELTSQIDTQRSSDVQLERILSDLLQIRQENQELTAMIAR